MSYSQGPSTSLFGSGSASISAVSSELEQEMFDVLVPHASSRRRWLESMSQRISEALTESPDVAVSDETIRMAFDFLLRLPADAPDPTIVVEPDGEIAFDWQESPRRMLSVSVGDRGRMGFAALIGVARRYGRLPLTQQTPAEILGYLAQLRA